MSINQIVTPLDSAVLETKQQYITYFKIVKHGFKHLVTSITQNTICNAIEAKFLEQYLELILYSLEAFRIKYLYNEEEKMRIDLTESGLPNYLEFRYLLNDLELKHEFLSKLPPIDTLKEEFITTLLKNKRAIPEYKLQQAASIIYYTTVDKKYIFKRFVQGKIVPLQNNPEAKYLVSWSFYDVILNRPFICFMYFDLHKTTPQEYTQTIYEVLEQVADRNMSLDTMGYAIDKKLKKLAPKRIRKIDFGPLHTVFAKDDLLLTHVLLKAIIAKNLSPENFAASLKIEELFSTGSFKEGSFFNKQQLQLWENQAHKQYLFTQHQVMQIYYDEIPELLDQLTQPPIEIPALKQ